MVQWYCRRWPQVPEPLKSPTPWSRDFSGDRSITPKLNLDLFRETHIDLSHWQSSVPVLLLVLNWLGLPDQTQSDLKPKTLVLSWNRTTVVFFCVYVCPHRCQTATNKVNPHVKQTFPKTLSLFKGLVYLKTEFLKRLLFFYGWNVQTGTRFLIHRNTLKFILQLILKTTSYFWLWL